MATRKTRVRNADITPSVRTNVFDASPGSRFAAVELGYGLHANPIFSSYLDLRTGVYAVQTEMLDLEALTYKVDIDDDDERADGTVVLENRYPLPVAVACVRVIERLHSDNRPLPADALYGLNLPAGCAEISRYIGRLDDPQHQMRALQELWRSSIAHVRRIGVEDHVYAIVERPLERLLGMAGIGVSRVAEPIWLEEYQGVNLAIKLDPIASAANLGGLAEIDALDVSEGAVRFWGEVEQ
ncbi:hypothetical protein QE410_003254 [Microbacterium sp. SORGH_AS 1204]|uniref:hypothetical protein n=1 Tax=Microbacterium sp. SORGH_AS_1204 TaxID=3041785 RepID=UPI00278E1C28|nr:hypothetical protein [Microbacterium sp. SORGH_AS_1204]MDQ1138455.1 hypothetical protein [Microbacterium sp. SORGH_AS_1204]